MGPVSLAVILLLLGASAAVSFHIKRLWVRSSNKAFRLQGDPRCEGPLLSVIIPARNEENNLPALMETLFAQRYRTIEIIIVDDASTDDTRTLAAQFAKADERVKVVGGAPMPEGWVGKNWACHQGSEVAGGEYLFFVDCDVCLVNDQTLGGMVTFAEENRIDLYSVIPRQQLQAFSERFFGPAVFAVVGLAFLPLDRVNDPDDPKAAAVGQCMFFRREAYLELDGHVAIRNHILEDVDCARLYKGAGKRIALHYGAGDVTVRMYTCFDELWQGWGKNLYRAAADSPAKMVTILLAFSLAYLAPEALLAVSAISLFFAPTPFAVAAVVASGVVAAWGHLMRIRKYRAMCWPLRYEWGHSLAMAVALLLLVSSFVSDRRKSGIVWKGRRYDGGRLDG